MKTAMAMLVLLAAFAAFAAFGQAYPQRTVRVIVPHPPGGPGDVPPRGIAQALSQSLGQPFVIENRDGADGLIGAEACARAASDGYTLCATVSSVLIISPALRKDAAYDVTRFAPIVQTGSLQQLILANPALAANSMQEVFALARAKPEAVSVGTYGSINLASMFVQWAKAELGLVFYPVPYKNAAQALQAAIAGDVQLVTFGMGPGAKMVQSGKLKALAVSPRRTGAMPNVPSMREAGVQFDFAPWFGWFAPLGAPREVVRRLNGEIAKLLADASFNAKFIASQGLASDWPTGAPPEDFERFIRDELEEFRRLAKLVGLKPQ
jgi:tripartite-type tricarboxylate transporter receptor subunit TctC